MSTLFERFAAPARAVVVDAMTTAQRTGAHEVGPTYLLLALSRGGSGVAVTALRENGVTEEVVLPFVDGTSRLVDEADAEALRSVGIDVDDVLARMRESLGPDALAPRRSGRKPRFARTSKRCLELAMRDVVARQERALATEHVLLGVLGCGDPEVARVLAAAGTTADDVARAVAKHRPAA